MRWWADFDSPRNFYTECRRVVSGYPSPVQVNRHFEELLIVHRALGRPQ